MHLVGFTIEIYDDFTRDQWLRMRTMLSEISDDFQVLCIHGKLNKIKTGSGVVRHFSS